VILREWRAEIRRARRDEYVDYVRRTGLSGYRSLPGNLEAGIAVRDLDETRSEIVTLSLWRSEDDIRAFAGDDLTRAVYYPEDDAYLLTRPDRVTHYYVEGFAALQSVP
jgi:heme-degrading monooxygenase HmoA